MQDGTLMRPATRNIGAVQGGLGLTYGPIPRSQFLGANTSHALDLTSGMGGMEARIERKINELHEVHDAATRKTRTVSNESMNSNETNCLLCAISWCANMTTKTTTRAQTEWNYGFWKTRSPGTCLSLIVFGTRPNIGGRTHRSRQHGHEYGRYSSPACPLPCGTTCLIAM